MCWLKYQNKNGRDCAIKTKLRAWKEGSLWSLFLPFARRIMAKGEQNICENIILVQWYVNVKSRMSPGWYNRSYGSFYTQKDPKSITLPQSGAYFSYKIHRLEVRRYTFLLKIYSSFHFFYLKYVAWRTGLAI